MEFKIGNIPATKLKQKYGTPLYVYDEVKLEKIMADYITGFKSNFFQTEVLFASKAFSCVEMYKLVKKSGLGVDVVSGGEIYTAIKAGVNPSTMYFHGNNKQVHEIEYALDNNILNMVVDGYDELVLLEEISKNKKKVPNILFRLNAGIEAHTHKFIMTAHIDSKFGLLMNSTDLDKCLKLVRESSYLNFCGFHSHIGSQIFEINAFYAAIDKLVEFLKGFKEELTLNIGGGFGVRYTSEDSPIPVSEVTKLIISHTEEALKNNNVKIKKLIIEPGRSIVAESGYTLYTIGNTKVTPNREYYFIDGGMNDNIRPALYEAKYACDIVTKMNEEKTNKVCIAGKCCESGDIIISDVMLPKATRGDVLVVYTTGAYGHAMASNYNKLPVPEVVFVRDDKARVVIKRQSYEYMSANDVDSEYDEF